MEGQSGRVAGVALMRPATHRASSFPLLPAAPPCPRHPAHPSPPQARGELRHLHIACLNVVANYATCSDDTQTQSDLSITMTEGRAVSSVCVYFVLCEKPRAATRLWNLTPHGSNTGKSLTTTLCCLLSAAQSEVFALHNIFRV